MSCWFTTSIVLPLEVLTLLLRGLEGVPLVLIFCFLSLLLLLFLILFLLKEELFLEVAVIDERLDEVGEDGDFSSLALLVLAVFGVRSCMLWKKE